MWPFKNKNVVVVNVNVNSNSHKKNVHLIVTTLINNSKIQTMGLTLNVGQSSLGTVGLVDTDSNQPVAATFANVSWSSSDPTIATVEQTTTDPGTAKVTGIAAGSATANVTADATYTDSKTNQQVTKTLTTQVPITVAQVAAENVGLVVNFTTPA